MRHRGLLATAIGLVLVASCATPVEEQSWIRVRTAHFEIISSASPERTLAMARDLERFRAVVMKITSIQEFDPRVPTRMYVFRNESSFAPFRWSGSLGGYLLPSLHVNYMAVDAAATDEQPMSTIFHEYVHFVVRNQGHFHYPLWYGEGLAEYLSTVEFDGEQVLVGMYPKIRAPWLVHTKLLPLAKLLEAESLEGRRSDWVARFYAQSWALVHYLVLGSQRTESPRHRQAAEYVALINRGVPRESAIEQTFGALEELERELVEYVGTGKIPAEVWPASAFPAEISVRSGPASLVRVQLELAELQQLLGSYGRGHLRHARELIDHVLAAEPANPRARIVDAWLRGNEGALTLPALQSATAELPDDAFTLVRAGDLIIEVLRSSEMHLPQRSGLLERARDFYGRALELDPEFLAAYAGLGATYLFERADPEPGIRALEAARAQARWSTDVALLLAQLYGRTDHPAARRRARALLREVIIWSHDSQQTQQARTLLGELAAGR